VATPAGSSGGFTINAGYDGAAGGSGRIVDGGAGLLNMAGAVTLKAHGNIGDPGPAVAPVRVGNATSLATLTEAGNIYIDKTGALVISGMAGGGGQASMTTTGAITQTGPILNFDALHTTVTGAGGIILQNDLNTVDHLYFDAPGALAYHQAADYTVVQADRQRDGFLVAREPESGSGDHGRTAEHRCRLGRRVPEHDRCHIDHGSGQGARPQYQFQPLPMPSISAEAARRASRTSFPSRPATT
jgi:hypothetical protein